MTDNATHHAHCGCGDILQDWARSVVAQRNRADRAEAEVEKLNARLGSAQHEASDLIVERDALRSQRDEARAERDLQRIRADRTEQEQNTERDAAIRRAEAAEAEQDFLRGQMTASDIHASDQSARADQAEHEVEKLNARLGLVRNEASRPDATRE